MDELASLTGLKSVPDKLWPAIADPRVDATAFGKDGLASVRVPVMVFAGSGDVITPPQYHAYLGYEYLTTPQKTLVTLAGANHQVYLNPCADYPMTITDVNVFAACSDPV